MSTIVVARPDWSDTACKWGSEWLKRLVVKPAREAGFEVIDLYANNATRTKILDAMKRPDSIYFSGVGHGNANVFTGQRREHVFWTGDAETKKIAPRRHFNFLSCIVGKRLAKWIQEVGALGVHAYDDSYHFIIDRNNFPNKFATPFFDSHCTIDKTLFAHKTHGEAHKACLDRYEYWIANAPEECKSFLFHDKTHKVFYGNRDARIRPSLIKNLMLIMMDGKDYRPSLTKNLMLIMMDGKDYRPSLTKNLMLIMMDGKD